MHKFEFYVRVAGKDLVVRMAVSPAGSQAIDPDTLMRVMSGWEAVKSAYKVSVENGDKAEKLKNEFDYASWEMRDCR